MPGEESARPIQVGRSVGGRFATVCVRRANPGTACRKDRATVALVEAESSRRSSQHGGSHVAGCCRDRFGMVTGLVRARCHCVGPHPPRGFRNHRAVLIACGRSTRGRDGQSGRFLRGRIARRCRCDGRRCLGNCVGSGSAGSGRSLKALLVAWLLLLATSFLPPGSERIGCLLVGWFSVVSIYFDCLCLALSLFLSLFTRNFTKTLPRHRRSLRSQ